MPSILFLSESFGWSGGAKQLLDLALAVRKQGWDILLALPPGGQTWEKARAAGLELMEFKPRQDYDIVTAWRVSRAINHKKIDLVHAHHPRAHAVGLLSMYLASRRPVFVVTRRVSFPVGGNPFSRLKYSSSRITHFVAVAESVKDVLTEGGVDPAKITTIPSGVDVETFSPRERSQALAAVLGLPKGAPVIGLVGNFGPWKGQDVFLKAAAQLKREGLKAVYLLAGRDTQSEDLKNLAREQGLSEQDIRFLGFREDVPEVLSLLDVSVNAATAGEGLSGAIRESLAMAVPVVVSDFGGTKELVKDGVSGRLFKSADHSDLARALRESLADPVMSRGMAEKGRSQVLSTLSIAAVCGRVIELYRKLLTG